MANVGVIGAGIVGLATARELALAGHTVTVIEKEASIALHQTGRNSGVIHSGLYYTPGSQKAVLGVAGQKSMTAFAKERGIAHEITGKLVVATSEEQIPQLSKLEERAKLNGVQADRITGKEALAYEPHVRALSALRVHETGIIDYKGVCEELKKDIEEGGGTFVFNGKVVGAVSGDSTVNLQTIAGDFTFDYIVNCAGLYSDKMAELFGLKPELQIVPFRGEYYELRPELEHLVKGLIYPVPDPRFPFLGVHLTKMVAGGIHAGPNAVLALAREGYAWDQVNMKELLESLSWPGFQKLALKNAIPGMNEMRRSFSKKLFAASLSELVPGIGAKDIVKAPAGVRAQALAKDGKLVDDFYIQESSRQLHVLNAPSPAATAALEIGRVIASKVGANIDEI